MICYPLGTSSGTTRVIEGGREGPAVVLLHGVGARADRWRANVDALAERGFHVYALDFPGHGFAGKGEGPDYTVPGFARFVAAAMDALDIEHATLVGTSLGGHVAAALAVGAPESVDALVLVGTLGITPLGAESRSAIADSILDTSSAAIRRKLDRLVHDGGLVTEAWIDEEHRINNSPGAAASFAALAEYIRNRIDDDIVGDQLAAGPLRRRTLLVWGNADAIVAPSVATRSCEILRPPSPIAWIPDTSHAPYLEDPERFNQHVTEFLERSATERQQA